MPMTFNGVEYLDCNEMAATYGGSSQSWRRQARTGKVPAFNYRRKWYFNPEAVMAVAMKANNFNGNNGDDVENDGQRDNVLADFE